MTKEQYSRVHQPFFYIQLKNHLPVLIGYRDIAVERKPCIVKFVYL